MGDRKIAGHGHHAVVRWAQIASKRATTESMVGEETEKRLTCADCDWFEEPVMQDSHLGFCKHPPANGGVEARRITADMEPACPQFERGDEEAKHGGH